MLRVVVILFVFWYVSANASGLVARIVPIIQKATVEGNENYMKARSTINRYGSMHNFTLDVEVEILVPIKNMKMNTGYFVRTRNVENWMYNKTFDFCAFLLRPSIDRFASMVFEELRNHGNVPTRCPIKPFLYRSINNTLMKMRIPIFLPETSFGFVVNCFSGHNDEVVFRSTWYGRLKKIMV